jgi:hypothetical protein
VVDMQTTEMTTAVGHQAAHPASISGVTSRPWLIILYGQDFGLHGPESGEDGYVMHGHGARALSRVSCLSLSSLHPPMSQDQPLKPVR